MNEMETAVSLLSGKDFEKAHEAMSVACNTYRLDRQAFIELIISQNPKIKKVWMDICRHWIKYLHRAYSNNSYDDRNKQSCYIGYNLYNLLCIGEVIPDLPRESVIRTYIGGMAHSHKTIQQSFSSLIFVWFNYLSDEKGDRKAKKIVKEIKKTHGDRWHIKPIL